MSLFIFHLLLCLTFDTEFQEEGFINQFTQEIKKHISCCLFMKRGASSARLGFTRGTERRSLSKNCLEKEEKKNVQKLIWHKRFELLAWKSISQVAREMRKISVKPNKLKAIKFQINICVKGFKFDDFPVPHSNNGKAKTVEDLTQSLKNIIRAIAGRQMQSPEIIILSRNNLPVIGTSTQDAIKIDPKQEKLKEELE